MSTLTSLLDEIEAFLLETGMKKTVFGLGAVKDGKFVTRLRSGAGVTLATADRVRAYMADQRKVLQSARREVLRPDVFQGERRQPRKKAA